MCDNCKFYFFDTPYDKSDLLELTGVCPQTATEMKITVTRDRAQFTVTIGTLVYTGYRAEELLSYMYEADLMLANGYNVYNDLLEADFCLGDLDK